jgi:hypothetical protein
MMRHTQEGDATSRARVRRAVWFDGPERVPHSLPEPWGNDFFRVGVKHDPDWRPSVEGEDEWGCVWKRVSPNDRTKGQVKVHPIDDWAKLDDYRFPTYDLPECYEHIPKELAGNEQRKFVLASFPFSLIHRLRYLRGNREAMLDPYRDPSELRFLLERITQIALESLERLAPLGIDGIISADDWGLQDRSFMSPEIFCKYFKDHYARVYRRAHENGMLTFLHSCGHISELLEDFIDAELDVIQMDQQENMGIENLAEQSGGEICFWCPVDIQNTMVKGTVRDVVQYVKRLIGCFGVYDGGFISKWYGGGDVIGHSPEKVDAMAKAFVRYGRYEPTTKP